MKWFNNPKTLEELKKQYKKLAMKHHPDVGGNENNMKEVNAEYDKLFETLKNVRQNSEGKIYTTKTETKETPNEFKDIISKLIKLSGIKIEICGTWIWITGNTYSHKKVLKELCFRFSRSKTAWYYHTEDYKKTSNKTFTLDQIRELYGSETITDEPQLKLHII